MSREMQAFDRMTPRLRRAIDECPFGVSALLTEHLIARGRVSPHQAVTRIAGFSSWEAARDFNHEGQRNAWGRVAFDYI